MTKGEQYKINLNFLSCFRKVSSLGAFRVIIVYDCLLWALNSSIIVDALFYFFESKILRIIIISFCLFNLLWSMFVDLRKMHYIERGGFIKTMNFFSTNRRISYFIIILGYVSCLLGYIGGFGLRFSGKLEEMSQEYMFADKFLSLPIYIKIIDFLFLILMIYLHILLFWAIGKLNLICRMVRIEQEDVIITAMERDYLEEGFVYEGDKNEKGHDGEFIIQQSAIMGGGDDGLDQAARYEEREDLDESEVML